MEEKDLLQNSCGGFPYPVTMMLTIRKMCFIFMKRMASVVKWFLYFLFFLNVIKEKE